MLKLILSCVTILISLISYSECSYCTSIESAMENPNKVIHLDLKAQGLTEIPDELGMFVNLKSLDLSDNFLFDLNFEGMSLSSVESIDFENNPGINVLEIDGFSEVFPSLRKLNLDGCSVMFMSPEFGEMSKLEELYLSNNTIRIVPSELQNLNKLRLLDISNNNLDESDWLKELWSIEHLDLSGNPNLNLRKLGASLLFKENLETIVITPSDKYSGIPNELGDLRVNHLVLKGGSVTTFGKRITRNTSIKKLTFEDIEFLNPNKIYEWANQFTTLERISYTNMIVPKGFSKIAKVSQMRFKSCDLEDPSEMNRIPSTVKVVSIGQKVRAEEVEENGIMDGKPLVNSSVVDMSDEMVNNAVEPIVEVEQQTRMISSTKPQTVDLGFSKYEIPTEAFLTAGGRVYEGEVELKITEYNDPIMNALSGAPMVYRNDGENNVFSSSGMIDFRAYDKNGNELKANPNSIIQVEMQDLQPSKSTELYTYSDSDSNWVNVGVPNESNFAEDRKRILDSLNLLTDDEFMQFNQTQISVGLLYKKSRHDPYVLNFRAQRLRTIKRYSQMSSHVGTGDPDQYWIAEKVKGWKIDTIITKEIKSVLASIKKDQKMSSKYWSSKHIDNDNIPRIISNLKLEPNIAQDNYRLSFNYKDTVVCLPVIASFEGSPSRVQEREKRNYINFQKTKKYASKEDKIIQRYKEEVYDRQVQAVRVSRANYLAGRMNPGQEQKENLRFGLTGFGLINCDYSNITRPSRYVALDSVAIDEDGNEVAVSRNVRQILKDENLYMSTPANRIPIFKAGQIMIFVISAFEIAVIKSWETISDGIKKAKIQRINIDGVSPEKVRQKILDAG